MVWIQICAAGCGGWAGCELAPPGWGWHTARRPRVYLCAPALSWSAPSHTWCLCYHPLGTYSFCTINSLPSLIPRVDDGFEHWDLLLEFFSISHGIRSCLLSGRVLCHPQCGEHLVRSSLSSSSWSTRGFLMKGEAPTEGPQIQPPSAAGWEPLG